MISRYAEVCRSLVRAGRHDLAEMVLAAGGVFARLQWCWQQVLKKQHPDVMLSLIRLSLAWLGNTVEIDDAEDPEAVLTEHEDALSRQAEWGKYLPWLARQFVADYPGMTADGRLLSENLDTFMRLVRTAEFRNIEQTRLEDILARLKSAEPLPQGEILYRYPDGWTVQRLTTTEQLEGEASILEHCVAKNYQSDGRAGLIWSIRDKTGIPRVTIRLESSHRDRLVEVQGRGNQFPKRHVPRLVEMVKKLLNTASVRNRLFLQDPTLDLRKENAAAQDLSYLSLCVRDLSGLDLQGAYLVSSQFIDTSLAGAQLQKSDLRYADFTEADLTEANLTKADLQNAQLRGATLEYAKLTNAKLNGAGFTDAKLYEADLRGADLSGARLTYAKDLDYARLDNVRYNASTEWPPGFDIQEHFQRRAA